MYFCSRSGLVESPGVLGLTFEGLQLQLAQNVRAPRTTVPFPWAVCEKWAIV